MPPAPRPDLAPTRRAFLGRTSIGLGSIALASLLERERRAVAAAPGGDPGSTPGLIRRPHHRPKVKRVIFLYMAGGPSQFETFDYKPRLAELDGRPMPESYTRGQPIAQLQGQTLKVPRPLAPFRRGGPSGAGDKDLPPRAPPP